MAGGDGVPGARSAVCAGRPGCGVRAERGTGAVVLGAGAAVGGRAGDDGHAALGLGVFAAGGFSGVGGARGADGKLVELRAQPGAVEGGWGASFRFRGTEPGTDGG